MDTISRLVANPSFEWMQRACRGAPQKIRKEMLLVCRFMSVDTGGNLALQTQGGIDWWYRERFMMKQEGEVVYEEEKWETCRREMTEVISDPLLCGALIMSLFLAPVDGEEEQRIRMEAYLKEIRVMETDAFEPPVDYSVFFGNYTAPFHSNMIPNPRMAQVVHTAIDSWIQTITAKEKPILPSISSKLLPSFTREQMGAYVTYMTEDPETATPASLERLLVKMGITIEGECEMSQRWYTNGLGPRTYFVAGGSAYARACFMKNLWNDLADSLSTTNRRNRVNPRRIHVEACKTALFYDLTSFTSNMGLQRSFLENLATYCAGVEITVGDLNGAYPIDLEEAIRRYNQMDYYPEYRDRVFTSLSAPRHGVAGFLGVVGNIATCTFLHGAVLLQLVEQEDECGCAGDDAVVVAEEEGLVWMCVSLLGILALEKTFRLDDVGAVVYLKRRTFLDQYTSRLAQHQYFQLPSFLWAMRREDPKSMSRWREARFSTKELYDLARNSILASFRSAARLRTHASFGTIERFMVDYYRLLKLPLQGFVPQFHRHSALQQFVPSISGLGDFDFTNITIESLYPGWALLPKRIDEREFVIPLVHGMEFLSQGGADISYLKKVGVLREVGWEEEMVVGETGLEEVKKTFSGEYRKWVLLQVVENAPQFLSVGSVLGALSPSFQYDPRDYVVSSSREEDTSSSEG